MHIIYSLDQDHMGSMWFDRWRDAPDPTPEPVPTGLELLLSLGEP